MKLGRISTQLIQQSLGLAGMQALGMVLSFAFTILLTRALSPGDYGSFRYVMSYFALGMMLAHAGSPHSVARLLAREKDSAPQREYLGAALALMGASTLVAAVVTALVYLAAAGMGLSVPRAVLLAAPFLYVTLGQYFITSACQGLNRISVLAFQQVLPYLLLIPITVVQVYLLRKFSLLAAFAGYIGVFTLVLLFGFLRLGFSFRNLPTRLRLIVRENRTTGLPIYIGGVFGVGSGHFVAMWAAEFADPALYGQYALAVAVSAPLAACVSTVATVIFRQSAGATHLPGEVLRYAFALGILLWVVYVLALQYLLVRAFGPEYSGTVPMAQILAVAAVVVAWGDLFQRFLAAHGQGRVLLIGAISTGTVGLIGAAFAMPRWGVYGAVTSAVASGVVYLAAMVVFYRRYLATARISASQNPAGLPVPGKLMPS